MEDGASMVVDGASTPTSVLTAGAVKSPKPPKGSSVIGGTYDSIMAV